MVGEEWLEKGDGWRREMVEKKDGWKREMVGEGRWFEKRPSASDAREQRADGRPGVTAEGVYAHLEHSQDRVERAKADDEHIGGEEHTLDDVLELIVVRLDAAVKPPEDAEDEHGRGGVCPYEQQGACDGSATRAFVIESGEGLRPFDEVRPFETGVRGARGGLRSAHRGQACSGRVPRRRARWHWGRWWRWWRCQGWRRRRGRGRRSC